LVFTGSLVLHERTIQSSLTNTGYFRFNMLIFPSKDSSPAENSFTLAESHYRPLDRSAPCRSLSFFYAFLFLMNPDSTTLLLRAFVQRSFSVHPDFLLQLPKCRFFGAPYRLSCDTHASLISSGVQGYMILHSSFLSQTPCPSFGFCLCRGSTPPRISCEDI